MKDIRSLEQTLLEKLPWNKARIKFVTRARAVFTRSGSSCAKRAILIPNERETVMKIFLVYPDREISRVYWVIANRQLIRRCLCAFC